MGAWTCFEGEVFVIAHQRGRFGVVAGYYVADVEVVVAGGVVVTVGVVVALAASVAVCVSVTFHAPRSHCERNRLRVLFG